MGAYPNGLLQQETAFVPIRMSLVGLKDLFTAALDLDLSSKLTKIFSVSGGLTLRYFDNGELHDNLDDRSWYPSIRLGATTRFYRSLWWSVKLPEIRLYKSEKLGSSILFENRSYFEMEVIFLGI